MITIKLAIGGLLLILALVYLIIAIAGNDKIGSEHNLTRSAIYQAAFLIYLLMN